MFAYLQIHADLVTHCFDLLVARLQDNPAIAESLLYSWQELEAVVVGGLVHHPNALLRQSVVTGVQAICKVREDRERVSILRRQM